MSQLNLLLLPAEIHQIIFGYLDFTDLIRLSNSCRLLKKQVSEMLEVEISFSKFVTYSPSLQTKFPNLKRVRLIPRRSNMPGIADFLICYHQILPAMIHDVAYIDALDIDLMLLQNYQKETLDGQKSVLNKIEGLELNPFVKGFRDAIMLAPRLKRLYLTATPGFANSELDGFALMTGFHLPPFPSQLEELDLINHFDFEVHFYMEVPPCLKRLRITHSSIEQEKFRTILQAQQLIELDVTFRDKDSIDWFNVLSDPSCKLKSLRVFKIRLEKGTQDIGAFFQLVLLYLPQLTSLEFMIPEMDSFLVQSLDEWTPPAVNFGTRVYQNLTDLTLRLVDVFLPDIWERFPNLSSACFLEITNTMGNLLFFPDQSPLPRLTYLELDLATFSSHFLKSTELTRLLQLASNLKSLILGNLLNPKEHSLEPLHISHPRITTFSSNVLPTTKLSFGPMPMLKSFALRGLSLQSPFTAAIYPALTNLTVTQLRQSEISFAKGYFKNLHKFPVLSDVNLWQEDDESEEIPELIDFFDK